MSDLSPVDEDFFQIKKSPETSVSHTELKRKVQQFKNKLDEISRLYQIKKDNVTQARCYSSIERPTYEVQKPSSSHDSVDSGRGTSLSEEDREFNNYYERNSRRCVSEASFAKDVMHQNDRKLNLSIESRIPRYNIESPKKSYYRRSISSETVKSHQVENSGAINISSEYANEHRERCVSECESENLDVERVSLNRTLSNEERISNNKIKFLEKRNEELMKRCDIMSRENEQLKELSSFLSKGNYEENKERIERISQECEKLKKDKTKVEEELIKSQQMLNDSFRLRVEIEECLWKVQKDQSEKSKELKIVTSENEIVKNELEMMKKFCMENDEKIRQYQLLEIQLKECLQKAVAQIGELELQSKEKKLKDEFTINKLSDDYEKLVKEHEMTKILYSDALKKIDCLMKEITTLKQQLSLSDGFVDSPSSRRRWFANAIPQDEFFQNRTTIEDEASEYDSSSTFSSRASQRSRIPRRNNSFSSRSRSSSLRKSKDRPCSIAMESDSESIASTSISTISRKSDIELETTVKNVSHKQFTEQKENKKIKNMNDTDDVKLQRDGRNCSWYVPTTIGEKEKEKENKKNDCNNNFTKRVGTGIPVKTKPMFNEIVHPSITTDEVLKAVKSTQNISSLIGSPARSISNSRKTDFVTLPEEVKNLEKRLSELNAEKRKLETNLSRIPSKGSSKVMNSGTNARYWSNQEEKCEQRYDEVIKEISSVKLALKKLGFF